MLCEECRKKPASVHVTKIINNEKTERHLCEDCAKQEHKLNFGITPDFSVHQFLSNLLNYDQPMANVNIAYKQKDECSSCGLTYDQFVHAGKVGCSDCYDAFNIRIANLLKRIHGSSSHVGKVPKRTGGRYLLQRELIKLRSELTEHISKEEFEKAAEVRDRIKALENELGPRG